MSIAFRVLVVILLAFGAIWMHHSQFSGEDWTPTALRGIERSSENAQANPVDEIIPLDELATAVLWERSRLGREAAGGDYLERSSFSREALQRPPSQEPELEDVGGVEWEELPADGTYIDGLSELSEGDTGDASSEPESERPGPQGSELPGTPEAGAEEEPAVSGVHEILYTVRRNDSAWKLAERFLADGRRYEEIVAANPDKIGRDGMLREGSEIRILTTIPLEKLKLGTGDDDSTVEERSVPEPGGPQERGDRLHTAQRNESLTSIAQQFYPGIRDGWRRIFDANRDLLTSPDLVPEGTVLRIPAPER